MRSGNIRVTPFSLTRQQFLFDKTCCVGLSSFLVGWSSYNNNLYQRGQRSSKSNVLKLITCNLNKWSQESFRANDENKIN